MTEKNTTNENPIQNNSNMTADATFFVGLVLTSTGVGFIYWPLALIVPGVVLLGLSIYSAATKGGDDVS